MMKVSFFIGWPSYARVPSTLPAYVRCKAVDTISFKKDPSILPPSDSCKYFLMQGIPGHCHSLFVVRLWSLYSYARDPSSLQSSVSC